MKHLNSLLVLTFFLCTSPLSVMAGGVQENTNHSVEWCMTQNRNASTDADAAYFNPAGTSFMKDGLHLYVSNQFIYLPMTIDTDNTTLNGNSYEADKSAWLFPNFYAVYKRKKMAFSLGFMGIGGGGTGSYDDGVPGFETDLANTAAMANGLGVGTWADLAMGGSGDGTTLDGAAGVGTTSALNTGYGSINGYTADGSFEGKSAYYCVQANIAYALMKQLSLSAGYRFMYAETSYEGSLKGLSLATSTGNPVDSNFSIPQIAANFADKEVEVSQDGMAHGLIAGVDIKPIDELNVGIKFSWNSALKLKNDTSRDDFGFYPDGASEKATLPMMLALGFEYAFNDGPLKGLAAGVSANIFFNEQVDWDDLEDAYSTGYEIGIGGTYALSMIPLTMGFSYGFGSDGPCDDARSELNEALDWHNVGFGGTCKLTDTLQVGLAYIYTYYVPTDVTKGGDDVEIAKHGHDVAVSISYHLPGI